MPKKKIFRGLAAFIVFSAFFSGGCVYLTHYSDLKKLKNLADSQDQMQEEIKAHEVLFYSLRSDVLENKITQGPDYKEVVSKYGEPILCGPAKAQDEFISSCLYRHPTKYFSSDLIYLNFDSEKKLCSWEIIKANE
ncbi:MAG: hypothetical protein KJ880_00120 [Candidatus Omnitrophica bacterium]|nr:hypothetical protein [Candidatus Omnitrophota bacterium]MBU1869281.1 hypothetical protein [Candidatus Omnitrophota bacterium]